MIVLGDVSGIQHYVFDVAEEGGGQAQRLRARSFFVQLLAETAALRLLRALKWPLDSILLSGAGKFLLRGPNTAEVEKRLAEEQQLIEDRLLRETRAELRLTIAWADSGSETASYQEAQRRLQVAKARPWAPKLPAGWSTSRLLLAPLDTPCDLCRHAPAIETEKDRDTDQVRQVCRGCAKNREIGRRLPRSRWLVIRDRAESDEIFGFGVDIATEDPPGIGLETVAVANLRNPDERPSWCPAERFLMRRLMAHVPTDQQGTPVWFTELARDALGDRLLAVLKADADSLGVRFQQLLDTDGLEAMARLSERLDAFFAGRLRNELANHCNDLWQSIYTIFAGGDDLIMVGPWNVMLDFAGAMRQWFAEEFGDHGLTLSAGLELMKPTHPIKPAVERAELLLNDAKDSGKDRLAAFGQVWCWSDHAAIIDTAQKLVAWKNAEEIQRGWLHTLLELAMARHGDKPEPLATARLAYHVDRNWRKGTPARRWADRLINDFDDLEQLQVRYLPAIVRYALTATRTQGEED